MGEGYTLYGFRNSVEPAFCVTFDVDITNILLQVRKQNFSFTLAFVYVIYKCANEIEAFRYRFLEGNIVLFDKIDTAFMYLNKDTGLFKRKTKVLNKNEDGCLLAPKFGDKDKYGEYI